MNNSHFKIAVNTLETAGALEFFPGDIDLRSNRQLMYRSLSLHYFSGKDGTLGYFYNANSHVSLDWQGCF